MAKKTTKTAKKNGAAAATNGAAGVAAAVSAALSALATARAALAGVGLVSLTPAERHASNGRLRVGEPAAMTTVLDAMDAYPGLVASLADKDGGTDPAVVETAPARADLALWSALAPVAAQIDAMQSAVSDTQLASASAAKGVTLPAYAILRANASSNAGLGKKLGPAIAFYGQAAKQRVANQAKIARVAKKKLPTAKSATA